MNDPLERSLQTQQEIAAKYSAMAADLPLGPERTELLAAAANANAIVVSLKKILLRSMIRALAEKINAMQAEKQALQAQLAALP